MKQIYFAVSSSKLLSAKPTERVFQFPLALQFHDKVSKRFTVTFYIKF
jgi:hypothetical protein